ncbi:cytochrome P450 [Rhodocollybia butyracea]|uniref:Cytochrome P450 n=1 Tax=Rhodocollybia butyracea TaxID=206335 RepID=A0A9P5P6E6_9AGAR|nr:cytochrome P450 [Rhodocollybia butyracea]
MPLERLAFDSIALSLIILVGYGLIIRSRRLPLPPGPKGWPLIGNVFDAPKEKGHIAYIEMGHKYNSDMVYMNVAGMSMLILNSTTAVNDLFVARSQLYSNRCSIRVPHASSDGISLSHSEMEISGELSSANLEVYQEPRLQEGIYVLLHRLLETPKDLTRHLYLLLGGTILSTAYGISVDNPHEPLLELSEKAIQTVAESAIPGTHLVDALPILEHVPSWFPGAGFKRIAASAKIAVERMRNEPMEFVKKNMANGTAKSSIATRVLEKMQEDGNWSEENEEDLNKVLGTVYAAAVETTATVISTIVLGLVRNPDILKKGHAAVDAFVGSDRLPDFKDEGKIPYVEALIREGLRWRPVFPLAIPHCTAQEDVYRGYYIPANTLVLGNSWAILHDPAVYGDDVEEFRPERFLNPDGSINSSIPFPEAAFGYGRRICPGLEVAQRTIWLAVASMLACFDLTKACDKDGVEIDPDVNFLDGLISYPRPYECTITPRSKAIAETIKQNFEQLRQA